MRRRDPLKHKSGRPGDRLKEPSLRLESYEGVLVTAKEGRSPAPFHKSHGLIHEEQSLTILRNFSHYSAFGYPPIDRHAYKRHVGFSLTAHTCHFLLGSELHRCPFFGKIRCSPLQYPHQRRAYRRLADLKDLPVRKDRSMPKDLKPPQGRQNRAPEAVQSPE